MFTQQSGKFCTTILTIKHLIQFVRYTKQYLNFTTVFNALLLRIFFCFNSLYVYNFTAVIIADRIKIYLSW